MPSDSLRTADESDLRHNPDRSSYSYLLYGFVLRSQWKLPFAACDEAGSPDVELQEGSSSDFETAAREAASLPPGNDWEDWFQYTPLSDGSSYLRWPGLYDFLISPDGRRILGRPVDGRISKESFHTYLLSIALSFSLLKLGFDPLHATVVAVNGSSFGLLGNSGFGKSTLAGAFLQSGYPIVTDDLLILKRGAENYSAHPGPPRIKLVPKVARVLIGERVAGIPMNPLTRKLIIQLSRKQSFQTTVPLKTFYWLNPPTIARAGGRITIRRLSQRRALLTLLKCSYNDWVTDPARLNLQLIQYAQIASQIPVKLLSYPRRMSMLPAVRDAILADCVR